MKLSEVKLRMLDWLDDPQGDQFDDEARLKRILFDAYEDVVHIVDESPVPWNIRYSAGDSTIPNLVVWKVGEREVDSFWSVNATKVLQVCPLDAADRELPPYTVVAFNERNNRRRSTGIYIVPGFGKGGVLPIMISGHTWFIGLCDQLRTTEIRARVYWRPRVGSVNFFFKSDNDVPILVPFEYHKLIAIRAAILAKVQASRPLDRLADLWADGVRSLGSFTENVDQGGKKL